MTTKTIQQWKPTKSGATVAPVWVDTQYKTLSEARRENPNEYTSSFRIVRKNS